MDNNPTTNEEAASAAPSEVSIGKDEALQLIATQLCATVHNIKDRKKALARMNQKRDRWINAAKVSLVWAKIIQENQNGE